MSDDDDKLPALAVRKLARAGVLRLDAALEDGKVVFRESAAGELVAVENLFASIEKVLVACKLLAPELVGTPKIRDALTIRLAESEARRLKFHVASVFHAGGVKELQLTQEVFIAGNHVSHAAAVKFLLYILCCAVQKKGE